MDTVEVAAGLYDSKGKLVVQGKTTITVNPLYQSVARLSLPVSNPQLWWVDDPMMYSVKTTVQQGGRAVDAVTTTYGFRTIQFTADSGFYLNGTRLKIKGTCNH